MPRTKREVILDIQTRWQWARRDPSLRPERDRALMAEARERFGSRRAALGASSADPTWHPTRRPWTAGLVIERLRSVQRLGLSVVANVVDFHDASLGIYARKRFGSYESALSAAGIAPDDVVVLRTRTESDWLEMVRARATSGLSLRRRDVAREDYNLVKAIERIARAHGRQGWRGGLALAILDPDLYDPDERWSPAKVIEAIRTRVAGGGALRANTVRGEEPELYNAAKSHCGGWPAAVRRAGFDPRADRLAALAASHASTRREVLTTIKSRIRFGHAVDWSSMQRECPEIALAGRRLWRREGGWGGALRAAGQDPARIKAGARERSAAKRTRWTPEEIASLILDRLVDGRSLTPSALMRDGYAAMCKRIRSGKGEYIGLYADLGIALEDLGVRPRRRWAGDKTVVIRQLLAYHRAGCDLSAGAVHQYDPALHAVASTMFRAAAPPFPGASGWDRALHASGLDPLATRRDITEDNGRGVRFHNLCGELFVELGGPWVFAPRLRREGKTLVPDAWDEEGDEWIDFKLRAMGASVQASHRKYGQYARRLRIIYLMGKPERLDGVVFESVFERTTKLRRPRVRRLVALLRALATAPNPERDRRFAAWAVKWTKKRVLQEIKCLPESHLRRAIAGQRHRQLVWGAVQRFGAWYVAVEAAGIDPSGVRGRGPNSTREERERFVRQQVASGRSMRPVDVCATAEGLRVYRAAQRYEAGGWHGLVTRLLERRRAAAVLDLRRGN